MITDKKLLKLTINEEKEIYRRLGYKGKIHALITQCEIGLIWRYIYYLRIDEYLSNTLNKKNLLKFLLFILNRRRRNKLGIKLGLSIPINTVGKGITIYHSGNIIINAKAKIGQNCKLHGDNCIGNNGINEDTPIIGDNVDIGVGAKIIGDVVIADGCKIGANAVVAKSFLKENSILVGIPAISK